MVEQSAKLPVFAKTTLNTNQPSMPLVFLTNIACCKPSQTTTTPTRRQPARFLSAYNPPRRHVEFAPQIRVHTQNGRVFQPRLGTKQTCGERYSPGLRTHGVHDSNGCPVLQSPEGLAPLLSAVYRYTIHSIYNPVIRKRYRIWPKQLCVFPYCRHYRCFV
jgi:hypothetical protein